MVSYSIRCRQTVTNVDIPKLVQTTTSNIQKELEKVDHVSYTTDCWTAHNNPYMSLTGHYVDQDFVLHHCILSLLYVPKSHTAHYLAENLDHIIKAKWNLKDKVCEDC